jgi:hypothetical protein
MAINCNIHWNTSTTTGFHNHGSFITYKIEQLGGVITLYLYHVSELDQLIESLTSARAAMKAWPQASDDEIPF